MTPRGKDEENKLTAHFKRKLNNIVIPTPGAMLTTPSRMMQSWASAATGAKRWWFPLRFNDTPGGCCTKLQTSHNRLNWKQVCAFRQSLETRLCNPSSLWRETDTKPTSRWQVGEAWQAATNAVLQLQYDIKKKIPDVSLSEWRTNCCRAAAVEAIWLTFAGAVQNNFEHKKKSTIKLPPNFFFHCASVCTGNYSFLPSLGFSSTGGGWSGRSSFFSPSSPSPGVRFSSSDSWGLCVKVLPATGICSTSSSSDSGSWYDCRDWEEVQNEDKTRIQKKIYLNFFFF